ncbi:MAG: GNAT family N-acetyltransferase [Myxococcales bacterium]|nr:MAG: GNAT family N-acetyltransferase [Myxococcales bacterium]
MEKLQPQGGHVPITADHPYYRGPVRSLLIAGLRLERVAGKAKLAQNRTPAERTRLLASLWQRGDDGDPRAIERLRAANPDTPTPSFLLAPAGATLHAWPGPEALDEAATLLRGTYWNEPFDAATLRRAHQGSSAWVGARDPDGRLVATARAVTDGARRGHLYDVCVAPAWRGRGLGQAVVRLLLDHPRLRDCRLVELGTRDARSFYTRFGFVDHAALPPRGYPSTAMALLRPAAPPREP